MDNEASYICDACGEEIVIPIDPSAGSTQEYIEDCPVCCHSCVIIVRLGDYGNADISASSEQDRF